MQFMPHDLSQYRNARHPHREPEVSEGLAVQHLVPSGRSDDVVAGGHTDSCRAKGSERQVWLCDHVHAVKPVDYEHVSLVVCVVALAENLTTSCSYCP